MILFVYFILCSLFYMGIGMSDEINDYCLYSGIIAVILLWLLGILYVRSYSTAIKELTITEAEIFIRLFNKTKKTLHLKPGMFSYEGTKKSICFYDIKSNKKIAVASHFELKEKDQWEELIKKIELFRITEYSDFVAQNGRHSSENIYEMRNFLFSNKIIRKFVFLGIICSPITYAFDLLINQGNDFMLPSYFLMLCTAVLCFYHFWHTLTGVNKLVISETGIDLQHYFSKKKTINLKNGSFYVKINEKYIDFYNLRSNTKIGKAFYIETENKDHWDELVKKLMPFTK